MQIPLPAFFVVGAAYYAEIGVVLYRAARREDRTVRRWGWMVLAGNELWNTAFFARRSPRNGFWGLMIFLVAPPNSSATSAALSPAPCCTGSPFFLVAFAAYYLSRAASNLTEFRAARLW